MLKARNREELLELLIRMGYENYTIIEGKGVYTVIIKNGKDSILKVKKPYTYGEALEDFRDYLPERIYRNFSRFLKNRIETKALSVAKRFLKEKKRFLLISGGVGIGKTTACVFTAFQLYRYHKIRNPLFVSVPSLMIEKEEVLKEVKNSDCIILDDFNKVNEVAKGIAIEIFLHAWNKNKYILVNTNLSGKDLKEYFDQHLLSRIKEEGMIVEIQDRDYRVLIQKRGANDDRVTLCENTR